MIQESFTAAGTTLMEIEKFQLTIFFIARALGSLVMFLLNFWIALLLLEEPFYFTKAQTLLIVFVYSLGTRGFEIAIAPICQKYLYKTLLFVGYFLSSICLFSIYYLHSYVFVLICIIIFGITYSLTSLSSRLWLLDRKGEYERLKYCGYLYRIINVSAGLAMLLAFLLPYNGNVLSVFLVFSVLLMISALLVFLFFNDKDKLKQCTELKSLGIIIKFIQSEFKNISVYYFLLFTIVHLNFLFSVFPYYAKNFSNLHYYYGWIIALNPIMIILFQTRITNIFHALYKQYNDLGFLLGLLFVGLSFGILGIGFNVYTLVPFVLLFTVGEMLIFPHIDFALSKYLPLSIRPIMLSLTGLIFALGKTTAETGGVYMINVFSEKGISGEFIWLIHSLLPVLLGVLIILRLKKYRGIKEAVI